MRIAYILGRFPVLSETFIGEEIRALEAMGHAITILALHRPEGAYQLQDEALAKRTLYFAPIEEPESRKLIRRYAFRLHRVLPFMAEQTSEPQLPLLVHAAAIADIIKKNSCTHVHAHFAWGAATYAIAAAKLLKLPVSITCHGSDVYARAVDLAAKGKYASALVGVAPSIAADLQKIAPHTPCHTIYCGVDTARFKPLSNVANKHARWLFVGRLIDCKGVDDILAAWAQLPAEVRPLLDIVGDGALKDTLAMYVAEQGLRAQVNFLGARDSAWIAEQAPRYKAFIAAFKQGADGSRDTAPVALKEAMAMGLPIVTTHFADIPEVVGKDAAIFCPPSSPQSLAQAVLKLQSLPDSALQAMGRAARARAEERYSLTSQAEYMVQHVYAAKK